MSALRPKQTVWVIRTNTHNTLVPNKTLEGNKTIIMPKSIGWIRGCTSGRSQKGGSKGLMHEERRHVVRIKEAPSCTMFVKSKKTQVYYNALEVECVSGRMK